MTTVEQVVVGAVVSVAIAWYFAWRPRRIRLKKIYAVRWKTSHHLQPEEVLGMRGSVSQGFSWYFLPRDQVDEIRERIQEGKNVLVVGNPLAGKTRAVFEALRATTKPSAVTIPRVVDIELEDFRIPFRMTEWRRPILLLDDLNKFVTKQNFEHMLNQFVDSQCQIVATCRNGPELELVKSKLEQNYTSLFPDPIEVGRITDEEASLVAEKLGKERPEDFDGNIGSVILGLHTMRERYADLSPQCQAVMRSLKRLFLAGIFAEREQFSLGQIKKVCSDLEQLDLKEFEWEGVLKDLATNGFLARKGERVSAEEAYLEQIVELSSSRLENFEAMANVFAEDPNALVTIGNTAVVMPCTGGEEQDYIATKRSAVAVLRLAVAGFSDDGKRARAQSVLGSAHSILADVEDKAANCKKAIEAYQQALTAPGGALSKVEFATVQVNLGVVHQTLATMENRSANCRRAIEALRIALKVFTIERFPMHFASTQDNLGNAYATMSTVEDGTANCRKAIEAHNRSLRVYTVECFPLEFARTQNNLGSTYVALARKENREANCLSAIEACMQASKVHTFEDFPHKFAATQANLGCAYRSLAEVVDMEKNCQKAIEAYEQALTVFVAERYPEKHASVQNNLGNSYGTLAAAKDKPDNCRKAIEAYQRSLRLYTKEGFPLDFATTQNNLGNAYSTLARVEDKAANCGKAREAYHEAMRVYKQQQLKQLHEFVNRNLTLLEAFCADDY